MSIAINIEQKPRDYSCRYNRLIVDIIESILQILVWKAYIFYCYYRIEAMKLKLFEWNRFEILCYIESKAYRINIYWQYCSLIGKNGKY